VPLEVPRALEILGTARPFAFHEVFKTVTNGLIDTSLILLSRGTLLQRFEGDNARVLTVAAINEIGPNDLFLRETEDTETPSFEGMVENVTGIRNHVWSFENAKTDKADFRPVEQQPTIGSLLLPANVSRVVPQQFHLLNTEKQDQVGEG